jgi:hypothetical protein
VESKRDKSPVEDLRRIMIRMFNKLKEKIKKHAKVTQ